MEENRGFKIFGYILLFIFLKFFEWLPILFQDSVNYLIFKPLFYYFQLFQTSEQKQQQIYVYLFQKLIDNVSSPFFLWGVFIFLTPIIVALISRKRKITFFYLLFSSLADFIPLLFYAVPAVIEQGTDMIANFPIFLGLILAVIFLLVRLSGFGLVLLLFWITNKLNPPPARRPRDSSCVAALLRFRRSGGSSADAETGEIRLAADALKKRAAQTAEATPN